MRVQYQVDAFLVQLEAITLAYMEWSESRGDDGLGSLSVPQADGEVAEERLITIVDLFCMPFIHLYKLCTDFPRD